MSPLDLREATGLAATASTSPAGWGCAAWENPGMTFCNKKSDSVSEVLFKGGVVSSHKKSQDNWFMLHGLPGLSTVYHVYLTTG